MTTIGYVTVDEHGVPIRVRNGRGGSREQAPKIYSTAGRARLVLRHRVHKKEMRLDEMRQCTVLPVAAVERPTEDDVPLGFCLFKDSLPFRHAAHGGVGQPRKRMFRLYSARGHAESAAREHSATVHCVVVGHPGDKLAKVSDSRSCGDRLPTNPF